MHAACEMGHDRLASALIERYGMGVEDQDRKGLTPLARAAQRNQVAATKHEFLLMCRMNVPFLVFWCSVLIIARRWSLASLSAQWLRPLGGWVDGWVYFCSDVCRGKSPDAAQGFHVLYRTAVYYW